MLVILITAPVARGQMPTSLSLVGKREGIGRNSEAVFRIQIGTGATGAAFGIAYKLPSWPTPALVQGSPLSISAVNFTGSLSYRPARSPLVPKPLLKRKDVCSRRGTSPFATSFWIEVPANSSAQLELRGRSVHPYWPQTKFELAFSTFDTDEPSAPRNPLGSVSVPPIGLSGTHITMRVPRQKSAARKSAARRMTPEVVGRTDPPLRFERISIRAVRPSPTGDVSLSLWGKSVPSAVPLGSVLTDRAGDFRIPSQAFPFEGRYAIIARSPARGNIAADWNCGAFF